MIDRLRDLVHARAGDVRGTSAIEYGLLVSSIAAVIVLSVVALGGVVDGSFTFSSAMETLIHGN